MSGTLEVMNRLIVHRGPDSEGLYTCVLSDYSVAMGMRRLSIIDLESGSQPIISDDETKVIVFNGEIYNYKILRDGLINKGCVFKTTSDTEVILNLYQHYGIRAFGMLDGMFAFSIYDKVIDKVYLVRDFFGEKPLYYSRCSDHFVWSSELKSILATQETTPDIDKFSLSLYFQLTYIPAPFTIYEGVSKLKADHFIEFDCKEDTWNEVRIERCPSEFSFNSKKEAVRLVHDLVNESVYSRSVSDVPIGTFLSGGVDSSIVSLCLAEQQDSRIDTFSIGFEKKSFDESEKSRLVSRLINSRHHEFIVTESDLAENIDDVLLNFDEPFADSSSLAAFIVSKKTRDYVKVALTGDGGDEVFGGYNKYYIGTLNRRYTDLVPERIHDGILQFSNKFLALSEDSRGLKFKAAKLLKAIDYDDNFYYKIISLGFLESELQFLLAPDIISSNALDFFKFGDHMNAKGVSDFKRIDKDLSLEGDMLVKVDRTSMLASLECRAPFLNKDLWDLSNQLPDNYLVNGWDKKHILKEAFKGYFPKDFLNKSKKGFAVPIGDWLRSELRNELLSYVEKPLIESQGIFEFEYVNSLVMNHLSRRADSTFKVWTFFCFQKWYTASHRSD